MHAFLDVPLLLWSQIPFNLSSLEYIFLNYMKNYALLYHSVHCSINPSKKTPPLFHHSHRLKKQIFQWIPKIIKFFILNSSNVLKVIQFLVEIYQFEFLVMTEKNIFVYKLFWLLNISEFSSCKNCTPLPSKWSPALSHQPPL